MPGVTEPSSQIAYVTQGNRHMRPEAPLVASLSIGQPEAKSQLYAELVQVPIYMGPQRTWQMPLRPMRVRHLAPSTGHSRLLCLARALWWDPQALPLAPART